MKKGKKFKPCKTCPRKKLCTNEGKCDKSKGIKQGSRGIYNY